MPKKLNYLKNHLNHHSKRNQLVNKLLTLVVAHELAWQKGPPP